MYKKPESVLVIVHSACGQVLLLQKRSWPEFWQSVTGTLEVNEVPYQTAIREIAEETGLDVSAGNLIDCKTNHFYEIYPRWRHRYAPGVTKNKEHVFSFMLVNPLDVRLDNNEHTAYCWLPKNEAIDKVISKTNKDAIKRYVKEI